VTGVSFVLGVDPGPSTGIAVLRLDVPRLGDGAEAYQCNARMACWLLGQICERLRAGDRPVRGQVEGFAPGHGAGSVMKAGRITRDQVRELEDVAGQYGVPLATRYMGRVKPWSNDKRLEAAGLLALTAGGPHCRAGMRHALYASHWDCGYPDPLSRRAGTS
jgi:hypothetical protein